MFKTQCKNCKADFIVSDDDILFYEKIKVPPPALCPEDREKRRLLWCNEMNLYRRQCDLCKKSMLSMYDGELKFPVYCQTCWWGDKWDTYSYGLFFDFNRPFLEQFEALMNTVPHPTLNITIQNSINSDYINYAGNAKNCYLIFDSDYNEDCYYCYTLTNCKFCVDCLKTHKSEFCYECIDCLSCYNLKYSQNCQNCHDSFFLKNCVECANCYGCVNLRHKNYHIFNKPVSQDEYEKFVQNAELDKWSNVQMERFKAEDFFLKHPNKFMRGAQNEDCTGDSVFRSKNCHYCFDTYDSRDCKYLHSINFSSQDCYDMYQFGENVVQCYESAIVGYSAYRVMFCNNAWPACRELYYCQEMRSSKNGFGCYGLRHGEFSILNRKYTKQEYESLTAKIIEHMKKTNEWGEFFPEKMSPFAYNETSAMDHFPIKKEEALQKGFRWKEQDPKEYQKQTYAVADSIKDAPDSVTEQILSCEKTGKNFRITAQELAFYRKFNIPISRKCFDERHKARLAKRNPQRIFERNCMKCKTAIQTAYPPDRPDIVYCEKCYLETVY